MVKGNEPRRKKRTARKFQCDTKFKIPRTQAKTQLNSSMSWMEQWKKQRLILTETAAMKNILR